MSNLKCLTVFSNDKNEFPLNPPPIFSILIFYFILRNTGLGSWTQNK